MRRPLINNRPPESNAMAPVAKPGSISGADVGPARAGAEQALRTRTNPRPHKIDGKTFEVDFCETGFIDDSSLAIEPNPGRSAADVLSSRICDETEISRGSTYAIVLAHSTLLFDAEEYEPSH